MQSDDVLGDIEREHAFSQTQRPIDSQKYKSYHVRARGGGGIMID